MNLEDSKKEYQQLLRFVDQAHKQADYYQELADHLAEDMIKGVLGNQDLDLIFGYYPCETSPIGQCAYNTSLDPAWDFCLFCHDPYEIK